jgi:hypothetical protein
VHTFLTLRILFRQSGPINLKNRVEQKRGFLENSLAGCSYFLLLLLDALTHSLLSFICYAPQKFSYLSINDNNLNLANIFAVNALEESCIEFIKEHLKENNENALKFLDQEGDTTTVIPYICLQYIDARTLKSEQFLNISYGTFCLILREKEFDEIEHINAVNMIFPNRGTEPIGSNPNCETGLAPWV